MITRSRRAEDPGKEDRTTQALHYMAPRHRAQCMFAERRALSGAGQIPGSLDYWRETKR